MKLKFMVTFAIDVNEEELKDCYEADSIQEAAKNQQLWCNDGVVNISELVMNAENIITTVIGVEEE